jgi:acetyl-CoA acetyltransferase
MRDVVVAGVGMTKFGKWPDRGLKSLTAEAVDEAVADAGAPREAIGSVFFSNVAAGLIQGQESTRGQHTLRGTGLLGRPVVNVENACASGSTALHLAWLSVASGQVDAAIAVGVEKLYDDDKTKFLAVMMSGLDQDRLDEVLMEIGASPDAGHSPLMDVYAGFADAYSERTGATAEDFARVASKNHFHGSLNPKAQYRSCFSVEEVLGARRVSGPLTVPMCAPSGDGAAAVVVATPAVAKRWEADPVRILATVLAGGDEESLGIVVPTAARQAYERAGVSPSDIDVVECHDAAAPAELVIMEELDLCPPGDAPKLARSGETTIGGRIPINPSGGLESKGHPLGATGLAQVVELSDQLRGRCGDRQVEGARIALSENAGGFLGPDAAVAAVTILCRS